MSYSGYIEWSLTANGGTTIPLSLYLVSIASEHGFPVSALVTDNERITTPGVDGERFRSTGRRFAPWRFRATANTPEYLSYPGGSYEAASRIAGLWRMAKSNMANITTYGLGGTVSGVFSNCYLEQVAVQVSPGILPVPGEPDLNIGSLAPGYLILDVVARMTTPRADG